VGKAADLVASSDEIEIAFPVELECSPVFVEGVAIRFDYEALRWPDRSASTIIRSSLRLSERAAISRMVRSTEVTGIPLWNAM
jgi:hypothetical protein